MLNKNDRITLNVVAMSGEGFGIGRFSDETVKDFVVFVAAAAVGDIVEVLVLKVLKVTRSQKSFRLSKLLRTELNVPATCSANAEVAVIAMSVMTRNSDIRRNMFAMFLKRIIPIVPSISKMRFRPLRLTAIATKRSFRYRKTENAGILQ